MANLKCFPNFESSLFSSTGLISMDRMHSFSGSTYQVSAGAHCIRISLALVHFTRGQNCCLLHCSSLIAPMWSVCG